MPDHTHTSSAGRSPIRHSDQKGANPIHPANPVNPTGNPATKEQKAAAKILMGPEELSKLQNNLQVAGIFVDRRHLEMLAPTSTAGIHTSAARPMEAGTETRSGIAVYQITKLMYNPEEDSYEKLVSLYSALNSYGGIVAMILQSDGNKARLYLCTNTSGDGRTAARLLAGNLKGQFPGCEITELNTAARDKLLDSFGTSSITANTTVRSLSMIPSRRTEEQQHKREFSAQGYEKFVDAMNGRKYTLVILSQRISPDALDECQRGLENLFTCFSPYAKETATYGENESDSMNYSMSSNVSNSVSHSISRSFGTSHTQNICRGYSNNHGSGYNLFGVNFNSGSGTNFGSGTASGVNEGTAYGDTNAEQSGSAVNNGTSNTKGTNRSITMNRSNKSVMNLLEKLAAHIERINASQTFGMWNSACYLIADDAATATMGTSTLASLFSGDSKAAPRAYCNQWDATNKDERTQVVKYLQYLQHPVFDLKMTLSMKDKDNKPVPMEMESQQVTAAMMISGKEIPTMMGLPRKSVPGIVADSMAEFGRNIPEKWKNEVKRPIPFGNIYHMGQPDKSQTVLDLDAIASHMFICGASGSGKSNTTFNLLQELIARKVPFLVVEPAKGEYKIEYAALKDVNIFTADKTAHRMLRINPCEFDPRIHLREHLDSIVQVVSACWPLHGAMPGLLKQAFEQVYIDHGWDLDHSERILERGSKFPMFKDLELALNHIIDESPYSNQTKNDYKGALLYRVSSLCNGFEGQIFGSSMGIPDRELFGQYTIIDLSSLGSDETRALIMGMLIIKLKNYRKFTNNGPNSPLLHVTVLEEAHTILKRCNKDTNVESANVQGAAVESLCRCIAEMRSAGEGFMIIDQSPGAVDQTAIKNTAVKIVMRLPHKDDRDEMGAALGLNDNQMRELSRLDVGIAAIFHAGWTDTVLARMGTIWDKRYRVAKAPVLDRRAYIRAQGMILQQMYHNLETGLFQEMYDDVSDMMEVLCTGPNALALNTAKQKEMLQEVLAFTRNYDGWIRRSEKRNLQGAFFAFAFDFIQLNSVMRMCEVRNGLPTQMLLDQPKKSEIRKMQEWESNVRALITRYLHMPKECNPSRSYEWTTDATKAAYFWEIYAGILEAYAYHYRDTKDWRYVNAVTYLKNIHHFNGR
ncbi:MAG: ATP-binding protein [Clostridia bacterium]|nr:ATP-binding protein [Clostridia bacterium]